MRNNNNNKKSNKTNRPQKQPKFRDSNNFKSAGSSNKTTESGEIHTSPASNDPSWYATNPELLRAAASIPFSRTMGQRLPFNGTTSVPGIMSLYWYLLLVLVLL